MKINVTGENAISGFENNVISGGTTIKAIGGFGNNMIFGGINLVTVSVSAGNINVITGKNSFNNNEIDKNLLKELADNAWGAQDKIISDLDSFKQSKKKIDYIDTIEAEKIIGKIIYNAKGYENLDQFSSFVQENVHYPILQGEAVSLDDMPISYNIHLPKQQCKGILVKVYGGDNKNRKDSTPYKPGKLDELQIDLLSKGIAAVTLNLIDWLELDCFQLEMPKSLHSRIDLSINKMYNILANSPEMLHSDLKILQGHKIYLSGYSFGGQKSITHAEAYPGTFDGYISFCGDLSFEMSEKTDKSIRLLIRKGCKEASKWLCPANNIEAIQDSVLVVNNFDDNNVNVKTGIDWCKKAKINGKGSLVRAIFLDEGSFDYNINGGHGISSQKNIFSHLSDTVFNFLTKGTSKLETLTDLRVFKTDILANVNYIASPHEFFISAAYRIYKKTNNAKNRATPIKILQDWDDIYLPILKRFCFVGQLVWDKLSLQKEINRLKDEKLLTNEVLKKAIELDLSKLSFIKDAKFTPSYYFNNQKVVIAAYKEWIYNYNDGNNCKPTITYLLNKIYQVSPEILSGVDYTVSQWSELEAKRLLVSTITEEKTMIRSLWQELIEQAVIELPDFNENVKLISENID